MASNLQLPIEALIAMYQHLEQGDNVFWVNSTDYNSPLFISPNFKKVWGIEPSYMQQDPKLWYDSLTPESKSKHRKQYIEELTQVDTPVVTLEYSIVDATGKERLISDTSFKLYDNQGNHVGNAGIAKPIPEQLIEDSRQQQYSNHTTDILKQKLFPLLEKQFQLNPVTDVNQQAFYVTCGDHIIRLTRREAECLYYFFKGKSSKEIGQLLDISHRTVELYFDRIREKLSARTRIEIFNKINDRLHVEVWKFDSA